MVIKKLI